MTFSLVAVVIAGVIVLAVYPAGWSLALAVVLGAVATGAVTRLLWTMLAEPANSSSPVRDRSAVVARAAVVAVLVLAPILVLTGAAAQSRQLPDASAGGTLRDFLAEDDPYTACQYMTHREQQVVANAGGLGETCPQVLAASPPGSDTITPLHGLRGLHLRTVVRGGRVRITVTRAGTRPLTFALRRVTPAERMAFGAPAADWRIASGATALL
jgi:hypothetical protein